MTPTRLTGWRAEGPCLDWALWRTRERVYWCDPAKSIMSQMTGGGFASPREAVRSAAEAGATHVYDPRVVGRRARGWRTLRAPQVQP